MSQKLKIALSFDQIAFPFLPIKPCWLLSNEQSLIYHYLPQTLYSSECAKNIYITKEKWGWWDINAWLWMVQYDWLLKYDIKGWAILSSRKGVEITRNRRNKFCPLPLEASLFSLSPFQCLNMFWSPSVYVQSLTPFAHAFPQDWHKKSQCTLQSPFPIHNYWLLPKGKCFTNLLYIIITSVLRLLHRIINLCTLLYLSYYIHAFFIFTVRHIYINQHHISKTHLFPFSHLYPFYFNFNGFLTFFHTIP